jgi:hypothetical protein
LRSSSTICSAVCALVERYASNPSPCAPAASVEIGGSNPRIDGSANGSMKPGSSMM